jgi:hypothetical protein
MDKQSLDLKTRIENMSTEEFVQWMNEVFLNRNDHGYYCKIHEIDDDKYWSDYMRPIGAEIAIGIAKGVEWGRFNRGERYVMYVEYDDNFITFDTKEQFFNEIWPLDDIIYEMNCRR